MSTLSYRQLGVIVTIAVVLAGALFGGFVLFMSGRASGIELTSASLVPADAGAYVAFNTDLASSQWVATFKLIEKMGQENPERELKRSAEEDGGLSWKDDVAPFLGGNAAVYVRGVSLSGASFAGAVILRCSDSEKGLKVFMKQSGGDFEPLKHNGITYAADANGGLFAAQIQDHLVIAMREESIKEVIDVHTGKAPSLAAAPHFRDLRDELAKDFLAFVYVSSGDLLGDFFANEPAVKRALDESGTGDLALKPFAMVVGAKANAFQFQEASIGRSDTVTPLLRSRESRFAKLVPGDAAIFFSTSEIAETWNAIVKAAGPQLDDAIAESGEYRNLDDAMRAAGREVGLSSIKDVIDLLTGETAVAAWFPANKDDAEYAILAEVQNTAEARSILDRVGAANSSSRPVTEPASGTEITIFRDSDGQSTAYAVKDGYLLLGSEAGVKAILAGPGTQPLAVLPKYRNAVQQMPSALGTFAYFDLGVLLRLTGADGVVPQLDDAEKVLQGLIINAVEERGIPRVSGALTIQE